MGSERIVLLCGDWETTPVVYHFLKDNFGVEKVVMEGGVSRKEFLKKRAKKLGWFTVGGQVLFQLLIGKPLNKMSRKRIQSILNDYGLKDSPIPQESLIHVSSVNSDECLSALRGLQPDLVVVHGTRIISKKILEGLSCRFVNIHAGITPRYRGSHGAYWALANGDAQNCGVTVHLVDAGIDTGNILGQEKITITGEDNFATYAWLQLAEGLRILKEAIPKLLEGSQVTMKNELNSALWHHPTLWGYLYKRIFRGVK
jgi:folate-dependent phosphoribosylglycinamide formyltransferase PurN